jgi:hypothetical protein
MTAPEKRHDSPYSSSTEIPTSRSIQQDRATNIDAEEANAGKWLDSHGYSLLCSMNDQSIPSIVLKLKA